MAAVIWVALLTIFALSAAWMMLACVVIGPVMWGAHEAVISTRWFPLAVRYGLWNSIPLALRMVRRRGVRWNVVLLVMLVPASGYIAAYFLPGLLPPWLEPPSFTSPYLESVLNKTALIDGILGALLGSYVWIRGLAFMARPSAHRRGGLQRLWLPSRLNRKERNHLMLNVYWRSRIKTATVFASIYPWVFLFVAMRSVPANSSSTSSRPPIPPLVYVLILFLLLLTSVIPARMVARQVEKRMVAALVGQEICAVLEPSEQSDSARWLSYLALAVEPLGSRRRRLAQIAVHLVDVAELFDARQPRSLLPHPISTLLRATARYIRHYLGNEQSLHTPIPDDLIEILESVLSLLVGRCDPDGYQQIAKLTAAFDDQGEPNVNLPDKMPGRLATFANRTVTSVPKIALVITSLGGIALTIIAVLLVLLHRMNITGLLPYLR